MLTTLVFSSNTNCGKTLLSGGLLRAAARSKRNPLYIKAVQTGCESDPGDARQVSKWSGVTQVKTLFEYDPPVSPHLAAQRANRIPSSRDICQTLASEIEAAIPRHNVCIVETAGGVLSPFPDETPTADALELLSSMLKTKLKAVLVGDARLGGISQTLASLEALERRQYQVASLVLFGDDALEDSFGNTSYLVKRLGLNPPVRRVSSPVPESGDIDPSFFEQQVFQTILSDIERSATDDN